MRTTRSAFASLLIAIVVACSSDSTGPGASYENIAGSYDGVLVGLSQGVALDATFSLTLTQTSGNVAGSWALQGILDDGFDTFLAQGTGTITGTIAAGMNPSVNLTVRTGSCPNYQGHFSGAYDSANRRLTISGPVDFFAANTCTVVLSFPSTIILSR
jgi:hypothetical protein